MPEDLFGVLMRFHREVALPDIERLIDERLTLRIEPLRNEMLTNFDAVYHRFDRLESEVVSLNSAGRRIEE